MESHHEHVDTQSSAESRASAAPAGGEQIEGGGFAFRSGGFAFRRTGRDKRFFAAVEQGEIQTLAFLAGAIPADQRRGQFHREKNADEIRPIEG